MTAVLCEQVILHTGDMRWASRMARHPALLRVQVDLLYLDTTYAAPKHVHPPQVRYYPASRTFTKTLVTCRGPFPGNKAACLFVCKVFCINIRPAMGRFLCWDEALCRGMIPLTALITRWRRDLCLLLYRRRRLPRW